MSNYVLRNRGNFHLQLLRHVKDIAVFVVGSFLLSHSVDFIKRFFSYILGCMVMK